jgi:hypothetical protein
MSLNTIIIIDWDDTLFPTSAYRQQNITPEYLRILDKNIPKLLNYNKTFIVSNASAEWLNKSLNMLPLTKEYIKKHNIPIISAREKYQALKSVEEWKKYCFKDIINSYNSKIFNILSIGDSTHEYNALLDLHDYIIKKNKIPILKNVTFKQNPNEKDIIIQINVLNDKLKDILKHKKYVDVSISQ